MQIFCFIFRSAFASGDLQVSQTGVKATLHVGHGAKSLKFDLIEAKAVTKKTELCNILFRLAELTTDLETKLEKTSKNLDSLKAQKTAMAGAVNIFDADSAKKKTQQKTVPKQAGMSIINPGSRKRKAPRGVQFDDDDD